MLNKLINRRKFIRETLRNILTKNVIDIIILKLVTKHNIKNIIGNTQLSKSELENIVPIFE